MRILLLNQTFYPDVAATAQHAHDLARHLVSEGDEVDVITSRSLYGEREADLPRTERVDGARVFRVSRNYFGKSSTIGRVIDFALFYVAASVRLLTLRRQDVVICFTTPPLIALVGLLLRPIRRHRLVYWVMDLYPDTAVAAGMMAQRSLLARSLDWISRCCLRRADRVVVLGRCMLERVREKPGVDRGQIHRIGVWSDAKEVTDVPPEDNRYRDAWDLQGKFIPMYAGNFGIVHDVETMLLASERLAGNTDIVFTFVGGGKRKQEVEDFVRDRGIAARCEPYQPRAHLGDLLACADVHIVSLKQGFEGLVVPCKLFGVMAACRPTIFIGDPSSEIGRTLQEHDAGVVIKPGDVDALVEVIMSFHDDPGRAHRMGARARQALGEAYDRRHACEQWRVLLLDLSGSTAEGGVVENG